MSAVDQPRSRKLPQLPPLVEGQRLDRATFHERYAAMPPGTRAELVGGTVYMASPVGVDHANRDSDIIYWLGHYRRFTKGLRSPANATTIFADYGEPQPDCQLLIPQRLGGQTRIEGGYIVGAPELVVEVARTSRSLDLGPKKLDYERAGVLEYLFIGIDPNEVRWFVRRDGRFEVMKAEPDDTYRSQVFPGLWLDSAAFFASDMDKVIATLDRGLATAEHAAFAERLRAGLDSGT